MRKTCSAVVVEPGVGVQARQHWFLTDNIAFEASRCSRSEQCCPEGFEIPEVSGCINYGTGQGLLVIHAYIWMQTFLFLVGRFVVSLVFLVSNS